MLKVSAVRPWGFDPNENKVVTDSALVDPALEVLDGDLIITRANTPELVGRACFVRIPPMGLMLSDKTLRLVVNRQKLDANFAAYVLGTPDVRRQIEVSGTGSSGTMKNITQDEIRSLRVALPDLDEQRRAVERVEAANLVMEAHRADMGKLRRVKQGLMDDLLTGRVRVKADAS